jgi:hypothetical protein
VPARRRRGADVFKIDPERPSFVEAFLGQAGVGERVLAWTGVLVLGFLMALSLFTLVS